MAEPDLVLVRRLAARDHGAFEILYLRYAAAAYGVAYRVIQHRELAHEVVQEAYAALWAAPHMYDPSRGLFRTFFLSLIHHRSVDVVRREERLRRREREVNLQQSGNEDVGETVAEEADLADRRREVREAMDSLPPEQREALELMYFRGWTQSRIARERGIPLGTVKTRILAAMRRMRKRLK